MCENMSVTNLVYNFVFSKVYIVTSSEKGCGMSKLTNMLPQLITKSNDS